MKAIKLIELTDIQFQDYIKLLENIKTKYKENSIILDYDWNENRDYYFREFPDWKQFKTERLEVMKSGSKFSLNEFIIFDSEKPVAWMAYKRLSENGYQFIFDTESDEVPEEVIKNLIEIIYEFLRDSDNIKMEYYANDRNKKEIFSKLGVKIIEETINSILLKEDMGIEKLRNIVDRNPSVKDYNLVLYREIPEKIYDRYVDFFNEIMVSKEFYNPVKKVPKKYKKEDLLRSIRNDKEDGDPMYMFTLFDKENIVGFCKAYIQKEDDDVFIQHCGGLTAVAEKYRGKGFAKFLKARMYLQIYEDYPNFRHALTDTYPWNKYMFKINEELGFRIFTEGSIFKFSREHLENILK